jgi:tRNA A37 methylthiotransferase MiaB
MIDGIDPDSAKLIGRTHAHAPEVDGVVYVEGYDIQNSVVAPQPGEMIDVRITGALDYDLIGKKLHA